MISQGSAEKTMKPAHRDAFPFRFTAGVLSALILTSAILMAQGPPAAGTVVEGFVRNQNTGQSIGDVRVTLTPESGGSAKNAVTDADGRFILRDVVPGRYAVTAVKTLFFRPPRNAGTTALTVASGQQYKDVTILLLPTAVIAGRILDESRQAIRSVRVDALRTGFRDGQVTWTPAAQATSDDRGEYRLFNLPPGNYYIRATRAAGAAPAGQTYYPGVIEPRDAIPISLQAGMEIGAVDLQLRMIASYSVQLTLGGIAPNSTVTFNLQRRTSPIADLQIPRFEALPGNTYRLPGLNPGAYDIIVQAASAPAINQTRMIAASARVPVNITNDNVDLGTIALAPSVPVVGKLVPAETLATGLEANRLVLTLRPLDPPATLASSIRGAPDATGFSGIRADGTLQFPSVPPGRYQVVLTGLPPDTYLVGAREMGRDVLDSGYTVTGNQGPLELIIGGSGSMASVEGIVVSPRGDAVPFGTVALVPAAERRGNSAAFRSVIADQFGQFSMRALLPGDYNVFAWEEVENGAWQNAAFLKTVENRGQALRLQRGGQSAVNVRVIPAQ
jgi:protocatechuate 3,4-dioxygenase beta subunit